jgi:hypothetical protein
MAEPVASFDSMKVKCGPVTMDRDSITVPGGGRRALTQASAGLFVVSRRIPFRECREGVR